MDWITTVLGLLLTSLLTYYFTRQHYEKKRKDDLADRDFNRRVAVHDSRIKEINEFLDSVVYLIDISRQFGVAIHEESNMDEVWARIDLFKDEVIKVPSMLLEFSNKSKSIGVLNDEQLIKLIKELSSGLYPSMKKLEQMMFLLEDENTNISKVKKDFNFEEFENSFVEANKIVVKMKIRLDELAKTVK